MTTPPERAAFSVVTPAEQANRQIDQEMQGTLLPGPKSRRDQDAPREIARPTPERTGFRPSGGQVRGACAPHSPRSARPITRPQDRSVRGKGNSAHQPVCETRPLRSKSCKSGLQENPCPSCWRSRPSGRRLRPCQGQADVMPFDQPKELPARHALGKATVRKMPLHDSASFLGAHSFARL